MKKFIYSFILVTFSLLLAVMIFQWCKQFFFSQTITSKAHFSDKALMAGLIADTFRGLMLAILYPKMPFYNTSYKRAISFGFITSFIAGSLSIIYPFLAGHTDGLPFLWEEGTILLIQGLFSGLALGFVYVRPKINIVY